MFAVHSCVKHDLLFNCYFMGIKIPLPEKIYSERMEAVLEALFFKYAHTVAYSMM